MNKEVNTMYSTAQELHDKIQAIYDRIQASSQLKHCVPEGSAFAEQIFDNPFFKEDLQNAIEILKADLISISKLKTPSLEDLKKTRALLATYVNLLPEIAVYLKEYDDTEKSCPTGSWEAIFELDRIIKHICILLKLHPARSITDSIHAILLKQLAIVNDKNELTYIFAPNIEQFYIEMTIFERSKKTKIWYSLHILHRLHIMYDIKKSSGQYSSFLENQQYAAAMFFKYDFLSLDNSLAGNNSHDIDIEEYKMCVSRVWSFIKPKFLATSSINRKTSDTHTYNSYSGALRVWGITINFKTTSLRGRILNVLMPTGKPKSNPMTFDEIYEKAIEAEADPAWHELSSEDRQKTKNAIYEAYEGINERVCKKTQGKYLLKADNSRLKVIQ